MMENEAKGMTRRPLRILQDRCYSNKKRIERVISAPFDIITCLMLQIDMQPTVYMA